MSNNYTAENIEVLSGLEPVRKRPGMYTDTQRPNHLAQEVIDNSVDEALAGHAKSIRVTVYKDGSVEVEDDGRGMPVDLHPQLKKPGVEVILSTLHAGGKFSRSLVFSPSANSMRCNWPSRLTSTSSFFDSAQTTDTPTPCRPPENW